MFARSKYMYQSTPENTRRSTFILLTLLRLSMPVKTSSPYDEPGDHARRFCISEITPLWCDLSGTPVRIPKTAYSYGRTAK
ncbi:MAG: hypothetical protein SOZ80_03395 [Prevotella sp.]|uniref:hypothetical protein n=1 Tax=Prevotella sp. TaxID=59823 RepID=UPI002A8339F8|nr:hypothetical protein [Prevotella sp.]MDY4019807.1 hypothetical protein [Prevotella sp.]